MLFAVFYFLFSLMQGSSTTTSVRSCQSVQAENEYIKVKGMFESMQSAFQVCKVVVTELLL